MKRFVNVAMIYGVHLAFIAGAIFVAGPAITGDDGSISQGDMAVQQAAPSMYAGAETETRDEAVAMQEGQTDQQDRPSRVFGRQELYQPMLVERELNDGFKQRTPLLNP